MEEIKYFTLPLKGEQGTITYLVDRILEDDKGVIALLTHPLAKGFMIPFMADSREALLGAQTQTMGKSNLQRWIEYVIKNGEELDFDIKCDLRSWGLLLVVDRNLSPGTKNRLAKITGKLGKKYFNNDLQLAIRFIQDNESLLDDFNRSWFNHYMEMGNKLKEKSGYASFAPFQRETLFNIAGFALSQQDDFGGGS